MWVLKGGLLGLLFFVIGSFVFLIAATWQSDSHHATGLSVITGLTIHNAFFWAAFVASLVIGCAIVRSWPARG